MSICQCNLVGSDRLVIIFPKTYVMFSSATQPPRGPPRHNFVISAITFEGFKLRSSNLTHALLIEIEFRTSKMADQSEMARNATQSDFQTSKMAVVY